MREGATTGTITVTVKGDKNVEPSETFSLLLTGVTAGPATIVAGSGLGTIVNDD